MLKKLFFNLGTMIIIFMLLGVLAGLYFKEDALIFAPMGDIFMQLIKMLVIPLVSLSVISGAASLGKSKSAGKIGISTFIFYLVTTAFAVVLGLILGEFFRPGSGMDISAVQHLFNIEKAGSHEKLSFWTILLNIIPANPVKSFVDRNILQILFFCLFLGFGISALDEKKKNYLINFFNYLTEALIWMIKIVMFTAPIGVFGLMASSVGNFGFDILALITNLFIIYVIGILIHGFGFYALVLKIFSKMNPGYFYKKMFKAQIVALSTSSSMATLPVNYEVCEEELKVSKETTSFVLPLGATINMDGNAIYYALAATFFAQLFGIDLHLSQYIAIIVTATIGSIGQAGVPGPSLLVVAVLIAAGIPIEGLPLLYAVDRLFDMLRTALNITGDASCAVIVDRLREN